MYSVAEMDEISAYTKPHPYSLPLIANQLSLNPTKVETHRQRDLCRVEKRNGKYGGYRKDILKENLTKKENDLVICEICEGIMREACLTNSGEQFCFCCEERNHSKQTPNEVVRKMINSLECCCPLLERGCEWLGALKDCEEHLETCGYVRDQCKLGCGAVLHRNKLRAHEEDSCPNRKVKCEHCNECFTFRDLITYHKECPKMELSCGLACGVVMCREDMAQHLEQECSMVVETCELGCGVKMIRNKLKMHLTNTCVQRMIQCEHCKKDIKFCDATTHLEVCPKLKVSCELACGEVVCREDMAQHLVQECVEKVIMCPFAKYNCEVTSIKRKHLGQHLEEKRIEHLELKLNAVEEEVGTYREECKQQRKEMNNQIIRINRMSEHINVLCSISDTTKLDWNIENLSKFVQINHIPERRNIAGCDISIHFLKENIYVSYADTQWYRSTFSAKYLICLYSTIRCKVVKQYDCGRVDVYGIRYSGEYEKKGIAFISVSDAEELSLTGSANKLILEMFITKL